MQRIDKTAQLSGNQSALASSLDTSFLLSSTLTLLRRKTQPGLTSGCATYTLNLQSTTWHDIKLSWTLHAVRLLLATAEHTSAAEQDPASITVYAKQGHKQCSSNIAVPAKPVGHFCCNT